MSDLKEFWDEQENDCKGLNPSILINTKKIREAQGYFFWEQGGKEFVKIYIFSKYFKSERFDINKLLKMATYAINFETGGTKEECLNAQVFIFCFDCLGEDKVKELIKGVEIK